MKRCLTVMLCLLTFQLNAGLQQQAPSSESALTMMDSTKHAYDKRGDVDLEPLLDLKIGDTVAFKLEQEVVVGVVKQREFSPDTGLKLFGVFPGHNKAGFLFHFGAAQTVRGMLFFVDRNATYNLTLEESSKRLMLERRDIQPRTLPPVATK